MPKNIVICLDGTGNQIEEKLSNVLKMYRTLDKNSGQVVYYDQGVGTLGQQHTWGAISQKAKTVWALGTGHGLDKNVLEAYRFLINHYIEDKRDKEKSDKIFIFGFSRGAHTARVLAGLIYLMGILRPDQINLAGSTLTAYKRAVSKKGLASAHHVRRITATKPVSVQFLGVWDTVSSVITPRADRFYLPSLEKLPYTKENPAVKVFRHAMAIDEKRRLFRLDDWENEQEYKPNIFSTGKKKLQDSKQVWFAGCHSDVGGGFKRSESAIAQFPLKWMIDEAQKAGIKRRTQMYNHVVMGHVFKGGKHEYPAPDYRGKVHNSMTLGWVWMEVIPKLSKMKEWKKRISILWLYIPWAEPRFIEEKSNVHKSAHDRFVDKNIKYSPKNFPQNYNVTP